MVSFIVNSFQRMEKVEEHIKQLEDKDSLDYKFSISKSDIFVVISMIMLIGTMMLLSNTAYPILLPLS